MSYTHVKGIFMSNPANDTSLENQLYQLLSHLDERLRELSREDEGLRVKLAVPFHALSEEDLLSRLLREVSQKTNLLNYHRQQSFHRHMLQPLAEQKLVTPSQLTKSTMLQMTERDREEDVWMPQRIYPLEAQTVEHNGITIHLTSLERSATKIRMPFEMRGTLPLEVADELTDISLLEIHQSWPVPTLAGISLQDDKGTIYRLESPGLVQGPQGESEKWRMKSYLIFSAKLPSHPQTFRLSIQSVLFLPQGTFAVLQKEPLMIRGPWEFVLVWQ